MTEHDDTVRPGMGPVEGGAPETADLEAEIERTREDLARTVDQLTERLDVKTRARTRALRMRDDVVRRLRLLRARITDERGRPTPIALGVGGGTLVATTTAVVLAVWRREDRHRRSRCRRRR